MMKIRGWVLLAAILVLPLGACNDDRKTGPPGNSDGFLSNGDAALPAVAMLSGAVFAPNGTVPVAGALVYLAIQAPDPLPTSVYCDECVHIAADQPYAISKADGTFTLSATSTGSYSLVVQKGGFRRVRQLEVAAGSATIDAMLTRLPGKTVLAMGDEVPRMTVVHGQYDDIEDSLMKLGIDASAIDIVQSALIGQAASAFLKNAATLMSRHIIFLPCGDFTQPPPNTDLSADPTIQANLAAFVAAGGRLYATDWHYDFIKRSFPGYLDWEGATNEACSACDKNPYDAPADIVDTALASWLGAQQVGMFDLVRNYTTLSAVNTVNATVGGKTQTVTPKIWMRAKKPTGARPATVSFEYGCGRVLFSTYHTEPSSLQLTPQERALLGILLDVSVCNDSASGVVVL